MKKLIFIVLILLIGTVSMYAENQFRLGIDTSVEMLNKPSLSSALHSFDDQADLFWGFHWQVILDHLGFGMHYSVKFTRLESGTIYDWMLDWNGDLFLSYHLLGAGRFLDPFLEIGYGNVGRVELGGDAPDATYWEEDESGTWHYITGSEWEPGSNGPTNLSLFPYIAGGLALDLKGLLVGAKFSWRPFITPIPASDFDDYPLKNFQITLFGGIAFGGHK